MLCSCSSRLSDKNPSKKSQGAVKRIGYYVICTAEQYSLNTLIKRTSTLMPIQMLF